jgi:hypothetical protein
MTKTKKINNKAKKAVSSVNDIEDFGKVYGWILYNSAYTWNFHSDSGCFYCTCQTQTYKKGNWTAIYQPSKEMKEYEEGKYYIIIKHTKNIKLASLNPVIKQVERLFLESYNDILKITNNKWSKKVNGTIEEVSQMIYPLKLENSTMKICFELRGMCKGYEWRSNDYWLPTKLGEWLGYKNENIIYSAEDFEHFNEHSVPAIL